MAKTKVSQYDGTMVKVGERFERFDKGSALPDNADPEHVELLEQRGMVADGEPVAGLAVPTGPAPFDVEADAAESEHPRPRRGRSDS